MFFLKIKILPIEEQAPFYLYDPAPILHETLHKYAYFQSVKPVMFTDMPLTLYACFMLKDILPCWQDFYGILINDKVKSLIEQFHPDTAVYRLIQVKLHHRQQVYDYYWFPNLKASASINTAFGISIDNDRNYCISEPLKAALEKTEISGCDFVPIETLPEIKSPLTQNKISKTMNTRNPKQPLPLLDMCVLETKSVEYLTKDRRYIRLKATVIQGELKNEEDNGVNDFYDCFLGKGVGIRANLHYFEKAEEDTLALEIKCEYPVNLEDIEKKSLVFCSFNTFPNPIPLAYLDKTYYKSEIRTWMKDKVKPFWAFQTEKLHWKNLNTTQSRILGKPSVPDNFQYPYTKEGKPLAFLAQLNLSAITQEFSSLKAFSKGGMLSFFLDVFDSDKTWPCEKDRFKVFYFPENLPLRLLDFPIGLALMQDIQPLSLFFTENIDWDSEAFRAIKYDTNDEIEQHLLFIKNALEKRLPQHRYPNQILGFSPSVQADVRFDAQKLSKNMVWPSHLEPDYVTKCEKLAQDINGHIDEWQLLLYINNADRIGLGSFLTDAAIYFMIRKTDLAQQNFDNIQVVLQNT
jgi:Domain of unknown function (DUF1963)